MYDVIVIGMGPAGLNAAIYAKRSGLSVLMFEKDSPGGLLNKTNVVDNYLGFESVKGPDLASKMFFQTQALEIPYKIEEVRDVKVEENKKIITTTKSVYEAKTLIICGGRQPRRTNLENESSLVGKGLSYCAICDAPLYRGKKVAIIGGGNAAFEEGIYLSDFVSELYILNRSDHPRADEVLQKEASEKNNIKVMLNSVVKEIKAENDKVSKIVLTNGTELDIEGVFVYIGFEPKVNYLNSLNILTPEGYVDVDDNMRTKVPGIYAAGDIIKKELYQIITAASEGAIAAISAKKDIKNF